ncbi:MAG TPA: type II secretion system F family protein [Candidatus Bathyarchaeia archaeon]|nr:type II secretion system F family protein [Candidatus Bathyarchaeia archaeon]
MNVSEKIKTFQERLKTRLQTVFKAPKQKSQKTKEEHTTELEKLLSAAYPLIGEKISRVLPLFRDLDSNLQKAELKINFKAYVSLTVFATIIATISVAVAVPFLLFLVFHIPFLPAFLFGVGAGLLAGTFSIVGFYFYPIYRADKHKRALDDELPFTTGYMAILASAGVSPEKIFYSLSTLKVPLAASSEARDVIRHINLFGLDVISALEKTSSRTPSEKLRGIIEGIISTMHSGGNLAAYLREKFKTYIKLRKLTLKKFSDTLSVLAEVYVTLLLTAPLLLIIMLSVMSVLGGGSLGGLSSDLLLSLMTYIAIPICAIIFLIILDSTSPKW